MFQSLVVFSEVYFRPPSWPTQIISTTL